MCGVHFTVTTESRAAMAKMSAHDTTPLQAFSNFLFILPTTPKPLTELLFAIAVFSPVKVEVSSRRIDPSQPCKRIRTLKFNNKYIIYITYLLQFNAENVKPGI